MILKNNSEKVIKLVRYYETLEFADKLRLAINIFESDYIKIKSDKMLVQGKNEAKELFLKNIKSNGKYLYFCPPLAKEGINDIDSVMAEVKEWLIE